VGFWFRPFVPAGRRLDFHQHLHPDSALWCEHGAKREGNRVLSAMIMLAPGVIAELHGMQRAKPWRMKRAGR